MAPFLLVGGALAISAGSFFLFTLPKFGPRTPADPGASELAEVPPPPPPPPVAVPELEVATPSEPEPDPATEATPRPVPIADPGEFLAELFRRDAEGDGGSDAAAVVRAALRDAGFILAGEGAISEIGKIAGRRRFAVEIARHGEAPARSRVTIDLEPAPGGGWVVAAMKLPDALDRFLAAPAELSAPAGPDRRTEATGLLAGPSQARSGGPVELIDAMPGASADPLDVASAFLDAVVARDFGLARRMTDPERLSDEKLAALFIVIEDGGFERGGEGAPLLSTVAREDAAWIIARLAASEGASSEFGIELEARAAGAGESPWRVVGLNFSQAITELADSLGAAGIGYAPIVNSPGNRESLVLYFPFNEAEVRGRAARQLAIVAEILKADPSKTITVDGYADGVGSSSFNDRLSDLRAKNVTEALAALGVPPAQIIARAFGERNPVEPNVNPDGSDNPAGRTRNRRAEVYLDF